MTTIKLGSIQALFQKKPVRIIAEKMEKPFRFQTPGQKEKFFMGRLAIIRFTTHFQKRLIPVKPVSLINNITR